MKFEEALQYLLSLGHETLAMKLGLRTLSCYSKARNPQRSFESVQIAGTNGKGSTAVVLDSICRASGINTGLYTSPHLVSITERIVIGGHEISEDDFARFATQVRVAAEDLVARGALPALPTFFEHAQQLPASLQRSRVELRLEQMGGRLDATTVAAAATVAITPLALDHQEHLGQTLKEIAFEKAAIIRPGVTAIVAAQPAQALEVILQRCAECNVEPSVDEVQTTVEGTTRDGRFRVTFQTSEDRYERVLWDYAVGTRFRMPVLQLDWRVAACSRFDTSENRDIEGIEALITPADWRSLRVPLLSCLTAHTIPPEPGHCVSISMSL